MSSSGYGQKRTGLELERTARPWEFVSALGTRGALLGDESGSVEAWVYPLKILRNFQLHFKIEDQTVSARAIVRSVSVRPESTTITYAWDTFSVRETLFVPVHEPGAVIEIEVDAAQPVEVEATFERDFQLEWPGAMGGSDIEWNAALRAFVMTESQQKFTALIGSPAATGFHQEYVTNYTAGKENSISFGVIPPGKSTRQIVLAASFDSLPPADATYKKLATNYKQLLLESSAYYQKYLDDHLRLELPDADLQQAYEWAQVSLLQGLVTNPYLGTGLVAGYRVSGEDQRPGYAWFFGRDALWTSLGLDAEGDFATTKTALEFLQKYQRSDGKVTHEIAQGASFVPWFKTMPFAYASADATPLFIVAMNDYVQKSGDIDFAKDQWTSLWNAYHFIVSTYDGQTGLPRNEGIGHGWIEGGPLYPAKSELYQTAVVVEALRSLSVLAGLLGKSDVQAQLEAEYEKKKQLINQEFWLPDKSRFAFALDTSGNKLDTLSVLGAVPMWFGLLDPEKAEPMITQMSGPDMQTDWGMRIIPAHTPKYDGAGYHAGTIWPLFTGWAAVGDYRYHQAFPAYANLRANALLTFDGSLGHVTEVLSGNYYQTLATGSPQQVWSSSMVISAMLTGMLGIDGDAIHNKVTFASHVPPNWTNFKVQHVQAGSCLLDISYEKVVDQITMQVANKSGKVCTVNVSPAFSLRSHIMQVDVNGKPTHFYVKQNELDQHVEAQIEISLHPKTIVIHLKDDFGLFADASLPSLGETNRGLRITSQKWNEDKTQLTLLTSSASGGTYELGIWNPAQIASVEGAELLEMEGKATKLRVTLPDARSDANSLQMVTIHFNASGHPKRALATE